MLTVALVVLALPGAPPVPTSLTQLVVAPERFDGRAVKVTGLLSLRPSAVYLFPGAEERRYFITEAAIAVDPIRAPAALGPLDGRWVTVAGTFHARATGGIVVRLTTLSPAIDYETSPMPSPFDWRAVVIGAVTAAALIGVMGLLVFRLRRT